MGVNWDFLIDIGYPWRTRAGYDWFRTFSLMVGIYEAKFGYFFEKGTELTQTGEKALRLSAGVGFYLGYGLAFNGSIVWARVGIGVFAIFQGTIVLRNAHPRAIAGNPGLILRASMEPGGSRRRRHLRLRRGRPGRLDPVGALPCRLQGAITCTLLYVRGSPCALTYDTTLSAHYSASVRVGSGPFKWTFSVSGTYSVGVAGRALLS